MVKKQQMRSNLSCLVSDRSSVMKKSNTLFNERRENIFKRNIPAFSVQEKSRSVSVLQKNMVTIAQNISES
jgi:acetolactate synthase small subunit